jgi:type I restriction enzyme, S subunit
MMIKNIGKTCNITTGKLDANKAVSDGDYPFFTCAPLPDKIDTFVFDDDVVLVAGNNANGNFHVSRFKGKFNAYQRTYVLTAKKGEDIDYVYYSLKLELKRLRERSQGSQTKFLTMPILSSIVINDIEYSDQVAISSILSRIDKKIELNNKINKQLEAITKLIYDYWFVQFDFPDENGKPYKSSGGKMVYDEDLKREVPYDWKVRDFGANNEIRRGNLITSDKIKNGNVKLVSAGVKSSHFHDQANRSANVITVSSSGANAGYINFWREPIFASDCITVQAGSIVETILALQFLKMTQKHIYRKASGSAQPHVYPADLSSLKYLLPPKNLIDLFEFKVIDTNDLIGRKNQENDELEKLRDWLLPMLMNGQVTVSKAS